MKPSTAKALREAQATLTKIANDIPTMAAGEAVDVASELKAMGKLALSIVDGWEGSSHGEKIITRPGIRQLIRPEAKPDPTRPRALIVMGSSFRAVFSPSSASWIDRAALASDLPKIAAKYERSKAIEALRFEGIGVNAS